MSPPSQHINASCIFLWACNIIGLLPFLLTCPLHLRSSSMLLAPVLALFHSQGIPIVEYLGDLLEQSSQILSAKSQQIMKTLQRFWWIINLQESAVELSHHLDYLDLILDIFLPKVFFPWTKSRLCFHNCTLQPRSQPILFFAWGFWAWCEKNTLSRSSYASLQSSKKLCILVDFQPNFGTGGFV